MSLRPKRLVGVWLVFYFNLFKTIITCKHLALNPICLLGNGFILKVSDNKDNFRETKKATTNITKTLDSSNYHQISINS